MAEPTVVVDPRCRIPYYTYVLLGLAQVGRHIVYRRLDWPGARGMAMLLDGRRVWVDTEDSSRPLQQGADWPEIVARINTGPVCGTAVEVPLGPLFGVRMWRLPAGYLVALRLWRGGMDLVSALKSVRYQGIARVGIEAYVPGRSDPNYLFARSQVWTVNADLANQARANFVAAVRDLPIEVDVAMVHGRSARMNLSRYLAKTARSAVVFNTPAMHNCLGWKLGEFLALGKAIVSLPFEHALPSPLVHGEHIHFVPNDVDAIRAAVTEIIRNHRYRRHLEVGARRWFDEHMSPQRVGERLVQAAAA